jgi:hypothetical protein
MGYAFAFLFKREEQANRSNHPKARLEPNWASIKSESSVKQFSPGILCSYEKKGSFKDF